LRRTTLGITGRLTPALCDALADVVAVALGWSAARRHAELKQLADVLGTRHGVTLGASKHRARGAGGAAG
jgi:glycerol-3-phosphate dehydrogenase